MKLATLRTGEPDGRLLVVSRDLSMALDVGVIAPNLLRALERWDEVAPLLHALSDKLNAGMHPGAMPFEPRECMAPLPRCFQWCDGSAFLSHRQRMDHASITAPLPELDSVPLMYQGGSDNFLGACDDVRLPDERQDIDFEGEFGVVVDRVPMGATPAEAARHIRLLVQLNDWSLRALGPREMRSGFGLLQAKPSTSFAPVAITPDELGDNWRDGRVHLDLEVEWNEQLFGRPNGREMHFSFGELIAHAASTRRLSAGTIVGSGTVSNKVREAGTACIAERRMIELLEQGAAATSFMRFGDRVRMRATTRDGEAPFGAIEQRVVGAL
ncbi:fumarylacetoacetate hydrolase [Duganella sp. FT80W]|uniref:Fumarylacetoacetate hydrolase n=1 Tax=Duganella guangzhouensis TaxID=2666084 RepID=A0A6I2KUV9_9BURK|nr:fumarylacetoacetate hydrolase family protein [Duganella guangzhouensis]MRW89805.1 fumarylacetoacetate hydrolase [Duganella guangzhouensis]